MNKAQLPECGLSRKSAVLLAIFFAIVSNLPAQGNPPMSALIGPSPSPSPGAPAPVARDAQGNVVPATGAAATAERVIVTGSNIPTAEEVGVNPVDIYNRETISKSGQRTTEQFLQSLPTVNANIVPQSNNENGSNTAVGAATIALRGFDARATLILIDGRRVAPYPTGNNPGLVNVMFVDLNSIPEAAIDSIEILKDGASTTYGADAVAGVVNIKLRHNYQNGAEATVQYGNTEHEDSGESIASAIFGVGNDTTNITGVLNYYRRNSIFQRDRAYSAVPPFLSSNNSPYNLSLSSNVAMVSSTGTAIESAVTGGLKPWREVVTPHKDVASGRYQQRMDPITCCVDHLQLVPARPPAPAREPLIQDGRKRAAQSSSCLAARSSA